MIGIVFGGVFVLTGLFAFVLAWKRTQINRDIRTWPKARGRIMHITQETRERAFRDQRGYYYLANVPIRVVKYTYNVDGHAYSGELYERVKEGSKNRDVDSAYTAGQEIELPYHPEKPEVAYLEGPRTKGAVIAGWMGVVFIVIGIVAGALVRI